jgi:signal peptidase
MTKGDANEDVDPGGFVHDDVVGKVIGSFPFLGKLIDYIKTDEGLGLLVVAPASYIIFKELHSIRREIKNAKLDKYRIE